MTRRIIISLIFTSMLAVSNITLADPINISDKDSIETVLTAQMGKQVTIRTKSGQELTGTVTAVTGKLTHIAALAGKEFYDAVVANKSIEAVVIRTK